MSGVTHAFIADTGPRAFIPDASSESLCHRITRIVGIMIFRMRSENIDVVSIKVRPILAIRLGFLRQGAQRDFLAQPIGNLQQRGIWMGRAIPCSEARIGKPQTAGRCVQKCRHDDACIWDAIRPWRASRGLTRRSFVQPSSSMTTSRSSGVVTASKAGIGGNREGIRRIVPAGAGEIA
ncbi:hypothetical protein A3734_12995 [Sulfitobacter sp. HI0054]|nr:hypothetical protein A3734_12995 [Sulfitobacter sp. HI0054]